MRRLILTGLAVLLAAAAGAYCIFSYGWLALSVNAAIKGERRFDALDAARPTAPYLSDFLRLFPDAEVNYRYFSSDDEPGFDVGADLHGRYELTMQLPARFDSSRSKVIGYGEPQFYLFEVECQNGRETIYSAEGERHFGSAEWQRIVASGGDFGVIGSALVIDRPVPGFRERKQSRQMDAKLR